MSIFSCFNVYFVNESSLQVKRVELSDEEPSHKADDCEPPEVHLNWKHDIFKDFEYIVFALKVPFEAGEGIPLELNPTVGRKLAKETLDLAPAHITMKLLRLCMHLILQQDL